LLSGPLNKLTRKDCPWQGGELPPDAFKAYKELKHILVSEPIVDYPCKNRRYSLIVDAATGSDNNDGGLGAILTQTDENGKERVIAYASRALIKHEKNYTPFLLEMLAASWAMDYLFERKKIQVIHRSQTTGKTQYPAFQNILQTSRANEHF